MLSTFRFIARSLSLVALLALVAPSWAHCRPLSGAASHSGMSCCMKVESNQGKLDSGCCTVRRAPESEQAPATKVTVRTAPAPLDAPAEATLPTSATPLTAAFHAIAIESGPPGPPLYLRLSVIRR